MVRYVKNCTFFVEDETTGTIAPPFKLANASAYYDGTTAEYVDERPKNLKTNNYFPLLDYSYDSWSDCAFSTLTGSTTTETYLSNSSYYGLIMETSSTHILSQPAALSNNSFADWYVQVS